MAISVDLSGEEPTIGELQELFRAESNRLNLDAGLDLLEDGRFLMVQGLSDPDASEPRSILVTQNWAAEYEDR